ncbi:carboxypeptidase-like regulatory domain-containing protein [Cellulosilyticum sp. I15G10I2]|uniref:carboxypeptidase-like regulatory domain-containing protein n=1 Tax=Cellulosilyticum sp. I15G10I2 TaxID=1892843 RepID=UPI00114CBD64|nr:carboxypeptidase-like regulatory domain-containing protein [Cellulosilyticum sp. I15G10I2]
MKGRSQASIILCGSKLRRNRQYNVNVILRTHRFQIIRGTVYDHSQQPSIGAVVQITQIRADDNNKRKILGYCSTDENGEYVFAISALACMKYEMAVYAPLS